MATFSNPAPDERRVLIVDDNEDAAELMAEVIGQDSCSVQIAHDGATTLELAEGTVPHVALLDIGLPSMDGYELARRFRSNPRLAGVRLIAVTGYSQRSDIERALAAGFDDHLVKPVDFDLLQSAVFPAA